jgi:hypothetical protein
MPANAFPSTSFTAPAGTVTEYTSPGIKLELGVTTTVLPIAVTSLPVTASVTVGELYLGVSVTDPVPVCTVSVNVKSMLVETGSA